MIDNKECPMLKRVISDENGRTLVWALVIMGIGALLIPTFLSHASTNLLATHATEEDLKELYAADSGVEYALLQLKNGVLEGQQGHGMNNKDVEVTWGVYISPTTYVITSVATSLIDGSSTTIVSYVGSAESETVEPSGSPVFEYAVVSLDGDVMLDGSSKIVAEGTACGVKAHANGNIELDWSTRIDGIANVTGTVDIPEWGNPSDFYCDKQEDVDRLIPPEVATSTYKEETQEVQCAECGDYTVEGPWDEPAGTYGRVHARDEMNIDHWGGGFTFTDAVCAGITTGKDININWSAGAITFEGPVRVGGNLNITGDQMVIFKGPVCVGQNLNIPSGGGTGEVIFEQPVKVGGDLNINYPGGNWPTDFYDTVYVGGNMIVGGGQDVSLGGTVYVCGYINMGGDAEFQGGETIVAEGNVTLGGSAKLALEDIPCVISLGNEVSFSGDTWVSAAVYAPYADIELSGSSKVYGALVGKSINMDGAAMIEYPPALADREDLPGNSEEGEESSGLAVMTYNINP
jgi:hypothetical protein